MRTCCVVESPRTPSEWQAAVDAAEAGLALESARLNGLVLGGPRVDGARPSRRSFDRKRMCAARRGA